MSTTVWVNALRSSAPVEPELRDPRVLKARRALKGQLVPRVLRVPPGRRDLKGPLDRPEPLGLKGPPEQPGRLAPKDQQARKEMPDLKAQLEQTERQERKVPRVLLERRVLKVPPDPRGHLGQTDLLTTFPMSPSPVRVRGKSYATMVANSSMPLSPLEMSERPPRLTPTRRVISLRGLYPWHAVGQGSQGFQDQIESSSAQAQPG